MDSRGDHRRLLALVALSVLVHAAVLLGLSGDEPSAPPRAQRPLQLDLAWVDVPPPPAPEPRQTPPPSSAPGPRRTATNAAPAAAPVAVSAPSGTALPATPGTTLDTPRAGGLSLLPGLDFALRLPTVSGGSQEVPRGTTIRNGPGEAPDPEALLAYTGETLSRRLTADLQQEVGLAAVAAGNVPGHFRHYEAAMRSALPAATIERTPMTGGELARDVGGILFNEGPSAEAARRVTDTPLGRSVASQSVMLPNVEDQRSREQTLQLLAQSENIKERIHRARLRTVLELTTDATGGLAGASIVERSGDRRFDESVLHFSRKMARSLPDSDDKQLGTSRWRSRWQFTWEPPDVRVRLLNAWRVAGE